MARASKKRAAKKAGKKASKRKPRSKKERTAKTLKIIQQRLSLHEKAAQSPNFKGGKEPVRSGCGRPRTKNV